MDKHDDIQEWIAGSSGEFEKSGDYVWNGGDIPKDWSIAMLHAHRILSSSRPNQRVTFLLDELLPLSRRSDLNLPQIMDMFKLLIETYPRYIDKASRDAVEIVGMELVKRDQLRNTSQSTDAQHECGVIEQVLGWLSNEVGQISRRAESRSYAAADVFVLISWSSGLYTICLSSNPHFTSSPSWNILVANFATLFNLLSAQSTQAKSSLRKSAQARVKRALHSASTVLPALITTLLSQAKSAESPLEVIPLAGAAIDTAINVSDNSVERFKGDFMNLYTEAILTSKSPVPLHVFAALRGSIRRFVSQSDLMTIILPTMEKAALRTPEFSLHAIAAFLDAYSHPIAPEIFQRISTLAINGAKSSNPIVRTNATELFRSILKNVSDDTLIGSVANDLLSLPTAGKTTGPDHRVSLYTILRSLPPSPVVSAFVVKAVPSLLIKETHDSAMSALACTLPPHIIFLLRGNQPVPSDISNLIEKEMVSMKPLVRRAFCFVVGCVLWDCGDLVSDASLAFGRKMFPSLESSLKNASTGPNTSGSGPLEGYIASAIILGPLSRSKTLGEMISHASIVQFVVGTPAKPSFLLSERVYQKISDFVDQTWLLRAIDAALAFFTVDVERSETLRTQLGAVLLHLAIESTSPQIRRDALASVEVAALRSPRLTHRVVREALTSFLSRDQLFAARAVTASREEQESGWNKHERLFSVLLHSLSFGESVDRSEREELLVELIVLAHHRLVCSPSHQAWIKLCQKAQIDPHELVNRHLNKLFDSILTTPGVNSQKSLPQPSHLAFSEASYRAVTTLVFVSPDTVLPRIMEQLRNDINPTALSSLTESDLGIWATPEGVTFVDVLSSKKKSVQDKKGKDYEIAQWEAELRKTLAHKKSAATPSLTKEEHVRLQTQLDKEALVRRRVSSIKADLERGLHLIRSSINACVDPFRFYIATVTNVLLDAALAKGSSLASQAIFDTYLQLAQCGSGRLGSLSKWVGIATLRGRKVDAVPENFQAEPLNDLVLRVLHRLRSLSEQAPLDISTLSYAFPLLSQVISQGGVGVQPENDPLEQLALSLDIIKFHCGQFSDPVYPRKQLIDDLLLVIRRQPNLRKEASSILVNVGEAICATSTRSEIDTLLRGTLLQEVYARSFCLQTLQPFDLTDLDWSPQLWLACHDDDEQNARLAQHIWEDNGLDTPETFMKDLMPFLEHEHAYVRTSAAAAIAEAVESWPHTVHDTLMRLQAFYREKAKIMVPEFDEYGMLITETLNPSEQSPARIAVACAFEQISPSFTDDEVEPFFSFLIRDEVLGDRDPLVRKGMLAAGSRVIDHHGSARLAGLIKMFEDHLASPAPKDEVGDHIKEAVVILFGRLARHLDASDAHIPSLVDQLVEALKTPSEQVQIAVSECLSPLVRMMKPRVAELIDKLFEELLNASKYAARRGAAYGLAGVIGGLGIGGMKEFKVISRLRAATEDKKRYEPRQGAMFAFETLCSKFGRLFEPYIISILPLLLICFGDAAADVREATQDAARVIMGRISGYGVKLILPSLLSGLEDRQWRTKKGSIELLGMMAYCSPRQLSLSLPIVIPRLTEVLTDSHAQVRSAANKSLKQFGEVIANPEIQSMVPVLLRALVDPAKTPGALSSLLKTSFVHYIDHSSLALIVPILERGLKERGADTKKKAAQIVGNLASLTDSKDFIPYLSTLLPMVHTLLVDPVPEARATAAKALGTLVGRLGEIHFPDLVPGLIRTLKTDTSGVDRQGAAQGLSEVLSGLGMERLEGLLPDIIASAQSPRSTVREGFMSLLVFLPATFGTRFQPHLPKIITPILSGLSDVEEYVRDAAMRAGRMVVTNYSTKAIDLLLPELEHGMFDPGWRIRQASITLVGELLFKVSGISGKTEVEEEAAADVSSTEISKRALVEILGPERRDRILAALYLARQDSVNIVRQASIHIWKALIHNTPRTVRELLPELIRRIIFLISSSELEQEETAARTTAELCRKFGEKILGEIIPIVRSCSTSPDSRTREGVCLIICEIMENTTVGQQEGHKDDIVLTVRDALVDDEANVRSAAARAFDVLQTHLGGKAINLTLPTLLEALRQPGNGSGTALKALTEIMVVRATSVFPVLIPALIAKPMTVFNARALAALVKVAGTALSKGLTVILDALVTVKENEVDDGLLSAVDDAFRALFASISDAEGLNTLMMILLGWAKHDVPQRRVSANQLFATFCEEFKHDASLYRIDWIRQLILSLEDTQVPVHTAAGTALDFFVKSIPKDELEPLVVPLRRSIESSGAPGQFVPGFSLPKGVAPLVPIIIAGLITGTNEQREQAAYAIGDLVERTDENAIKPFVVPFTGPLIRVATQATTYPPAVKTAILTALTSMLERIPAFVKPFFPQLQRTFIKSASDPASVVVRTRAAQALGALMKNQTRVDPVITELIAGANSSEEGIAASLVLSLANVVKSGDQNIGEKARVACVDLVSEAFRENHEEGYIQAAAALLVSLSGHPDLLRPIVEGYMIAGTPPSMTSSHAILAILSAGEESGDLHKNLFQSLSLMHSVAQKVLTNIASDRPAIARLAREARDLLKTLDDESIADLF